jgi:hypothetical protein
MCKIEHILLKFSYFPQLASKYATHLPRRRAGHHLIRATSPRIGGNRFPLASRLPEAWQRSATASPWARRDWKTPLPHASHREECAGRNLGLGYKGTIIFPRSFR